ncbi:hypothetical protein [Laribacter hongkongensis]|uniref:Uncharacterized protein n=1 Tax=Laribacter hongkongensis TaxID=168471 RepID=A0ABD4SUT0_9NEIS|nr:hypothetical protein [Laribacter hongkongensis]MCG9026777.1 hypothetical protein [Laribacter hongkongensis]MCG9125483.1 hypothetical protein [Laribacter hongkongensis]
MLTLLAMQRREIAGLRRTPSAVTAVANRYMADTSLDVFREQYQAVAEAADRHANDANTLNQAWPVPDRKLGWAGFIPD